MTATTVVHISSVSVHDPDVVYIGRSMPRQRLNGSEWQNPWVIGQPHPDTGEPIERGDAVILYATRTLPHLLRQPGMRERLGEIRGKRLGCWCAGKHGQPRVLTATLPKPWVCHGQALAAAADNDADGDLLDLWR